MIITHYQRGDSFVFTAAPVDIDGNPVTPDTVTLTVNYLKTDGTRADSDDVEMQADTSGDYSGSWTSRGIEAAAGRVYWSVQTVNPDSNEQGEFDLQANLANQAE